MDAGTVNVLACKLDEALDHAGFRHRRTSVRTRIGADRLAATVYEAEPGHPIWPYHYHYDSEEWVYVLSGEPMVRDGAGQRALAPGDLVWFVRGHRGAHTFEGPGRFLVFSTWSSAGPWISVYPDSDKLSVTPGELEPDELNALLLPRAAAVGYWSGEGDPQAPAEPVESAGADGTAVVREPPTAEPLPVLNALAAPPGSTMGGALAGATVAALRPGERRAPYHYVHGREKWLLVLAGEATVRGARGEQVLAVGDLACFPDGPAGAHEVRNDGPEPVRVLSLVSHGAPVVSCDPETGSWTLYPGPGAEPITLVRPNPRGRSRARG